ncbi:MAG: oligosaccharide flippase family protein [Pelobium sp.]
MNIFNFFQKVTKNKVFENFVNLSIIQVSNILLMILIFPVLTRIVGLENFGQIMVANALAGLLGIFVNYGTVQTSIKEIATSKDDKNLLSEILFNIFTIRIVLFIIVCFAVGFSFVFIKENYFLYVFALPLVFAEVVNPLFFFLGVENLKTLNIANLISKIVTLVLIIFLIHDGNDTNWVNFLMGSVLSITYIITIIWGFRKYRIKFVMPTHFTQIVILKGNFFLLVNNFAVHLQQSLMLFMLQHWGNAIWLGAYAICDKLIWSSRLLIISIFNSLYPSAAKLFEVDHDKWLRFKNKIRWSTSIVFLAGSLILFFFPHFIIKILVGEGNTLSVTYLREMAFVPFIASLNFMNVMDRLLHKDNYSIFKIALVILVISLIASYSFVISREFEIFGYYALFSEIGALLMYEYYVRKNNTHTVR